MFVLIQPDIGAARSGDKRPVSVFLTTRTGALPKPQPGLGAKCVTRICHVQDAVRGQLLCRIELRTRDYLVEAIAPSKWSLGSPHGSGRSGAIHGY
jgi:hypothetical protein